MGRFQNMRPDQIDIPLSSIVQEQVRCWYWLPRPGPSEMPLIWTITLLSLTQMLRIFLSHFMGTDLMEPKGLQCLCQRSISLAFEHIFIKTYFLQCALWCLKNLYHFQFYISNKLYSHMSIIRNVANSFETRLNIDSIQRNALCVHSKFGPKKSINKNCSYMRQKFPVKARTILTSGSWKFILNAVLQFK